MRMPRPIFYFWRNLFRKDAVDQALDAEVQAYCDLLADEKIKSGVSPDEARRLARMELGGPEQVKQQTREARQGFSIDTFLQDLQFGLRVLKKNLIFSLLASTTLILGIGGTTALFSIVDAVLIQPLPYPHSQQIAWITGLNDENYPARVSYPDFVDWRANNHSFSFMAAYGNAEAGVAGGSEPQRFQVALVTRDFFKVFDTQIVIGRDFLPEEHEETKSPAVVIGQSLWRKSFGGNPNIIGKTIRIDGMPGTIVGVMPPTFSYPEHTQVWIPAEAFGAEKESRTAHNWRVIGRVKAGLNMEAGGADISSIAGHLKKQYPGPYQSKDAGVRSLRSYLVGPIKPALLTLFAAVGLVLVIVCVNIANLLLALHTKREKEFALRGALGASWSRLARQLLLECCLLSAIGGILGVGLAYWSIQIIKVSAPATIPRMETVGINGSVLCFAVVASCFSCLLFACLPAWSAIQVNVQNALKEGAGQHTSGRRARRVGQLLVTSEIALAFMLLIGTGLLIRSFEQLQHQDLGFQPDHVLTASLSFPVLSSGADFTPPPLAPAYQQIFNRVARLPGVESIAFAPQLPFEGPDRNGHFLVEGRICSSAAISDASYRVIGGNYFSVLRIRLLQGRVFSHIDTASSPRVATINATLAKQLWPHESALGHRIWFDSFDSKEQWLTIVGVVNDVREAGPSIVANGMAYVYYTQHQKQLMETNLLIRTRGNSSSLVPPVRKQIHAISKDMPVKFQKMDAIVAAATAHQRFQVQMLGLFAWLAVILAGVGIFGVLSYLVDQSRAEIGIRMALGADAGTILRGVLRQGFLPAVFGVGIGLAGAYGIACILSSMLYGIGPADPVTYIVATLVVLAVVLPASWLPAYRAARTAPIIALRGK